MMMNPQLPFGLQTLNGLIELRSEVAAYANVYLMMVYVSLPAFLIIWMMRRPDFSAAPPLSNVEVTE